MSDAPHKGSWERDLGRPNPQSTGDDQSKLHQLRRDAQKSGEWQKDSNEIVARQMKAVGSTSQSLRHFFDQQLASTSNAAESGAGGVLDHTDLERREISRKFDDLQSSTHEKVKVNTQMRRRDNPIPTDEEYNRGAFDQEIEPQVLPAVIDFNRKGYSTASSGFGEASDIQTIDGEFTLDKETTEKIKAIRLGVKVHESSTSKYTWISFKPKESTLESIEADWRMITALIPDKGAPAPPDQSAGAQKFRADYPKDTNLHSEEEDSSPTPEREGESDTLFDMEL